MSEKRDKRINLRMTQEEYETISKSANDAHLSLTAYMTKCSLGRKIFVVEGIDELARQHRALGNNINQLTRLANAGQINVVNLGEFLAEYELIGKSIIDLLERRRWR